MTDHQRAQARVYEGSEEDHNIYLSFEVEWIGTEGKFKAHAPYKSAFPASHMAERLGAGLIHLPDGETFVRMVDNSGKVHYRSTLRLLKELQ